jgi:hypothetical protein
MFDDNTSILNIGHDINELQNMTSDNGSSKAIF